MIQEITVRSPAKINLTLDVSGLRADGYHQLRSVVHTIGIYDTIHFDFGGAGLRFRCDQSELCSDDNLCLKAARLWEIGANRVLDCEIELHKTIPTGAGLGGGSGNAAATLLTLNRHFDGVLDDGKLHEIAAKLGADVPLFLRGGCQLIEGIGEKIRPLRSLDGWILIAQPTKSLSTPQVFRRFDELRSPSNGATDQVLEAIENGANWLEIAPLLSNDLTQAAQSLVSQISELIGAMKKAGAIGAIMTGSGSAVFGVFRDEKTARSALHEMQSNNWNFLQVAPLVPCGGASR